MKGSIDDSSPVEITHETTYRYAVPKWSPDGRRIVYEFNESHGNVFVGELP